MRQAHLQAADGLIDGGADILMVETVFDTLNAKAALFAIDDVFEEIGARLPVMISGTITDASGRTLTGQTTEAFWNSVRHAQPIPQHQHQHLEHQMRADLTRQIIGRGVAHEEDRRKGLNDQKDRPCDRPSTWAKRLHPLRPRRVISIGARRLRRRARLSTATPATCNKARIRIRFAATSWTSSKTSP